jgi:hypothetical protein
MMMMMMMMMISVVMVAVLKIAGRRGWESIFLVKVTP